MLYIGNGINCFCLTPRSVSAGPELSIALPTILTNRFIEFKAIQNRTIQRRGLLPIHF